MPEHWAINLAKIIRRFSTFVLFALPIAAGVLLFSYRLAALYQQPIKDVATPTRFPAALAGTQFYVSPQPGLHRQSLDKGILLTTSSQRVIGQARVSLCNQRARADQDSPLIPLYIGWDWNRIQERINANLTHNPPREAAFGLKNPLLDDGPDGVDVPAVVFDTQPPSTALQPIGAGGLLQVTMHDSRPISGLSDVAADLSGAPAMLKFRKDAWLLWEAESATGPWHYALRLERVPEFRCALGALRATVHGPPDPAPSPSIPRTLHFYPTQGTAVSLRAPPGDYTVPEQATVTQEDADLFAAAVADELFRLDADGQIATVPTDWPRRVRFAREHPEWLVDLPLETAWLRLPWSEEVQAVHRLLYNSVTGRYVRQQADIFNAQRLLAAVRLQTGAESDSAAAATNAWQAESQSVRLSLTEKMPMLASGLFAELPKHWQPWQRVAHWPAGADPATPVRFTLPLAGYSARTPWQLLVVGRDIETGGVRVLRNDFRCLSGSPCRNDAALAQELTVQPLAGAAQLVVQFRPLSAQVATALFRHDFAHIHLENGQPRWQAQPPAIRQQQLEQKTTVTLQDRNGARLWETTGPTEATWNLGLAALVGIDPKHRIAVAGTLARLGAHGMASVDARLTLDSALQDSARQALLAQLPEVSEGFGGRDPYREQRFASLVVLDADQGDILAAVSLPEPPREVAWEDLERFNAARPRRGPLAWWAWHHDGSGVHVPGSTFKLVSALTLEYQAARDPSLDEALNGLTLDGFERHPLARRYDFGALDACYPAHARLCRHSRYTPAQQRDTGGVIHNFAHNGHYSTVANRLSANDKRYGLDLALRDSLNTWFAWLVETTDGTLLADPEAAGLPHARALTPDALNRIRPLAAVTAQLGFDAQNPLDGGLLPAGMLQTGDVLLPTPSHLDPIEARHQVRLAAVGFRMQATPLQMARVAATIATSKRVIPRLLLELNGQAAKAPAFAPLHIATERIRRGMKRVPEDGTLERTFAGPRFKTVRAALYAKTGTADLQEDGAINNAWLVGWVEPDTLPNEPRRLAFACQISHTRSTGGVDCGRVVARFLETLLAREPAARTEPPPQSRRR